MLAIRIIPTLLQRGSTLVKGERFNSWRSVGHALQAINIHQARGVDELIYLNIAATPEGRGPDFKMVKSLTRECFVPITVGGGVRSVEDVQGLLNAGADKVAICTAGTLDFILYISRKFGSQAIVVVVEHFTEINNLIPLWAVRLEDCGAGEILLQSKERDGTMQGYDLELIRSVCNAVSIPVIASGGCSGYEDMYNAIQAGASAVAAGALFQFTDATPKGAAEYLKARGIEVRIPA